MTLWNKLAVWKKYKEENLHEQKSIKHEKIAVETNFAKNTLKKREVNSVHHRKQRLLLGIAEIDFQRLTSWSSWQDSGFPANSGQTFEISAHFCLSCRSGILSTSCQKSLDVKRWVLTVDVHFVVCTGETCSTF